MTQDVERSGVRRVEHFLPRFLLNGFAAETNGVECYVFRFAPGRPGHKVNTRKVGGERDFYGAAQGVDVERQLSHEEARYAPLLERLREGRQGTEDRSIVAEFVNLLAVRGKYYRTAFEGRRVWRNDEATDDDGGASRGRPTNVERGCAAALPLRRSGGERVLGIRSHRAHRAQV